MVAALGGRATRAEERLELALGEGAAAAQRLEAAVVAQQRERRHPLDAVLPRVLPRHPDPEEDVEGAHVPRHVGQQRLGGRQVAAVAVARRVRREEHQHVVQPPLDLPRVDLRREPQPVRLREEEGVDEGRHREQVGPHRVERLELLHHVVLRVARPQVDLARRGEHAEPRGAALDGEVDGERDRHRDERRRPRLLEHRVPPPAPQPPRVRLVRLDQPRHVARPQRAVDDAVELLIRHVLGELHRLGRHWTIGRAESRAVVEVGVGRHRIVDVGEREREFGGREGVAERRPGA